MMDVENLPDLAEHSDESTVDFSVEQAPTRRVAVLVLAMHRSGSSAITRMLSLLGCGLPATLMSASPNNPQGHWESQRIADFNDEILATAGTQWDDWMPVNSRLSETLIWPQLVVRGRQALREEFAETPLFVLKDPRICRLAGLWLEIMAAEGVNPVFVLPVRNPIEVARSLERRDGIDEYQGLLIWLRHVLAAEAATRGRLRVFTDFATLLNNWEALAVRLSAGLGLVWPRVSTLGDVEISEFLTPDLRHHVSNPAEVAENPGISSWVRDAYEVLLAWASRGENPADYPKLDEILRYFDEAGIAFARPMFNAGVAKRRAAQVEIARVALAEERDGLAGERTVLFTERDSLAARLAEVEAALEQVRADRDTLIAERDSRAVVRAAIADERDKLTRRLGEVEDALEQVLADRDTLIAERDSRAVERAAIADERDKLTRRLGEVEAEHKQTCTDRDALIAERDGLSQERVVLADERDKFVWQLGEVESKLAKADADSAAAHVRASRLEEHLASAHTSIDELKHRTAVAESTLHHREDEIAQKEAELESIKAEEPLRIAALHLEDEAALQAAKGRLEEQYNEMARLTKFALEKEVALEKAKVELNSIVDQVQRAAESQSTTQAALYVAEGRINEHFNEMALLSRFAGEKESALAAEEAKRIWLKKVVAMRAKLPSWWVLMPRKWRMRQEHRRLLLRGLFDASAYLQRYPDVAMEGVDPVQHYILHGIDEGRMAGEFN